MKGVSLLDHAAALYRRFLDGDNEAFSQIMMEYRPPLIFFIHRYIKDLDMAEDIAIDVFCQVLLHPKRYHFKTSLKTYLFMIAKSRAIDYLRKQNRFRFVDMESVEGELVESKSLEEIVLENQIKKEVHKALFQLPEEMRVAVHLIYFEDLSYKDAAAIMKKTTKQIDNLLFRAKKLLKEILGEEGKKLL